MNNLSIIIIHWNTPAILKKQLQQLLTSENLQIIVIDNASEKPVDWVKKDFPKIELIENKFNRGYASACNQGALKSTGSWLLFLNPDVEINQQQIEELKNYAEKNQLDACSPTVGKSYQKPLPSWFSLLIEFTPLNRINNLINFINFKNFINLKNYKTLFGGCLLIKKEVLLNLGGWDERFFLWFEDSDLTKRLIDQNYKIGWLPQTIKHHGGLSFARLTNQNQRDIFFHSMDIYAKKHFRCWGKTIISLLKKRFSSRKLLPVLNNLTSVTVPNLKKELLESFFTNNIHSLDIDGVTEEWVVVTNTIDNQESWQWRNRYPIVRFILIEKNHGFASTVNIGLRVSTGKWLGTTNDDVMLSKNWLKNILINNKKNIGSINPIIKTASGKIESIGIQILSKGKALPITVLPYENKQQKIIKVDATNAAAVIYSKDALNKVGLFDEKFGSYLEDIDLSLRLSRAGFINSVTLNSEVVHRGQQSSNSLGWKKNWLDFKNWILVIVKNWGIKKFVLNLPAILIERLRNLKAIVYNKFII